jgi:transcriptional regulator with XRE-family HTH domain
MKSTYSDIYSLVIERLLLARKRKGITQVELAQKLGKPQSFISKIESGERRLDIGEFMEITHLLGEDPSEIIKSLGASALEQARRPR